MMVSERADRIFDEVFARVYAASWTNQIERGATIAGPPALAPYVAKEAQAAAESARKAFLACEKP